MADDSGAKATYTDDDHPGKTGLAVERQARALRIVRDVYEGTLKMRDRGEAYLPMFPKETPKHYTSRKDTAVLFNAFRRTVGGLTGMVFRKDPQPTEVVQEALVAELENVDMAGRDLATFARDHFQDAMTDGHAGIFVDMRKVDEGEFGSLLEERKELRPYWVSICKGDIVRFRTATVGGQIILVHLAFRETTTEQVGSYGEKEVTRIREFVLTTEEREPVVVWRTWRQRKEGDNSTWYTETSGRLDGVTRIPFAVTYTGQCGYLESDPPLLDLAMENVKHWQKRSDRDNVEHVACCPIFVLVGVDEDPKELEIGPTVGVRVPQGGDAKYAEPQGVALQQGRESLKDIEHRMALLGLSMLMSESRSAETATSKRIDKSESDSQLAAAAKSLQAALTQALRFHVEWGGGKAEQAGEIAVNMDFENLRLEPQMVSALADLVPDKLSVETLWDALAKGEVLPDTFDPETERQRLEEGDVAGLKQLAETLRAAKAKAEAEGDPGAGDGDSDGDE